VQVFFFGGCENNVSDLVSQFRNKTEEAKEREKKLILTPFQDTFVSPYQRVQNIVHTDLSFSRLESTGLE
jgi:hypothetical protein